MGTVICLFFSLRRWYLGPWGWEPQTKTNGNWTTPLPPPHTHTHTHTHPFRNLFQSKLRGSGFFKKRGWYNIYCSDSWMALFFHVKPERGCCFFSWIVISFLTMNHVLISTRISREMWKNQFSQHEFAGDCAVRFWTSKNFDRSCIWTQQRPEPRRHPAVSPFLLSGVSRCAPTSAAHCATHQNG